MDCAVERALNRNRRSRKTYVWRCTRCNREFPYEGVLHLAGCAKPDPKRDPTWATTEREWTRREKAEQRRVEKLRPKVEPDKEGKPRLVYR